MGTTLGDLYAIRERWISIRDRLADRRDKLEGMKRRANQSSDINPGDDLLVDIEEQYDEVVILESQATGQLEALEDAIAVFDSRGIGEEDVLIEGEDWKEGFGGDI